MCIYFFLCLCTLFRNVQIFNIKGGSDSKLDVLKNSTKNTKKKMGKFMEQRF